jgi:hypothetical protein
MKIKRTIAVLGISVLISLCLAGVARAQILADARSNTPGARANGMGGAFIAVADDASAAITNPAGLVNLTRPQLYGELTSAGGDTGEQRVTSPSFGAVAVPIASRTTLGFAVNEWFRSSFRVVADSYAASIATAAGDRFSIGATVCSDRVSCPSGTTGCLAAASVIVGALLRANDKVTLGLTGSKASNSDSASPQDRLGAGVAFRPSARFLADVDVVKLGGGAVDGYQPLTEVHAGGEYETPYGANRFLIRAGGVANNLHQGIFGNQTTGSGVSLGAGYVVGRHFHVDLAYVTTANRIIVSPPSVFRR